MNPECIPTVLREIAHLQLTLRKKYERNIFYKSSDSDDNHPPKLNSLPEEALGAAHGNAKGNIKGEKVIEITHFKCKNAFGSRKANKRESQGK